MTTSFGQIKKQLELLGCTQLKYTDEGLAFNTKSLKCHLGWNGESLVLSTGVTNVQCNHTLTSLYNWIKKTLSVEAKLDKSINDSMLKLNNLCWWEA